MKLQSYNVARAITPSDTVAIDPSGRLTDAVYVGGAGIIQAVMQDGTVIAFTVVAGAVLPFKIQRINATSTTATLLVALYQL